MKVQLIENVVSNNKKTVYGKKGDKCTVVTESNTVLIVENKYEQRYPVHISKIKIIEE